MPDQITNCVSITQGGAIVEYEVFYILTSGSESMTLKVIVRADEMSNPNNLDELKSIANSKASQAKVTWETELASRPVKSPTSSLNGSVTL